ncbi:MAG: DUF47 family protein [Candidatus Spechtbacterales bacterium]
MGKEKELFADLESLGNHIAEAGRVFHALVENIEQGATHAEHLHVVEHESDKIVRDIFTLVLPKVSELPFGLDHMEMTILVRRGDSVVDSLWQAANKIGLVYQLEDKDPELDEAAQLLLRATQHIQGLFVNFKRFDRQRNLQQVRHVLHEIESRADELRDAVVKRRFAQARQDQSEEHTLLFGAWKEVYDEMEHATDICEDIIDVLGDLHRKYS